MSTPFTTTNLRDTLSELNIEDVTIYVQSGYNRFSIDRFSIEFANLVNPIITLVLEDSANNPPAPPKQDVPPLSPQVA
jgi:hypothetical protein